MKPSFLHSLPSGKRFVPAAGSVCLLSTLIGCGVGGNSVNSIAPSLGSLATSFKGSVHGGQQPVVGARVQIFLAGTSAPIAASAPGVTPVTPAVSAYGTGATPLSTAVLTDANGGFNIPAGNYVCPAQPAGTQPQQAYIIATGGNTGGGINANSAMLAALGTCPPGGNLIATTPTVIINEVTTVAGVWALQQFMAPPAAANSLMPNIGAPNTTYAAAGTASFQSAVLGMDNAFVTAKVMADVATGSSPNTNFAYATPESAKIFTLADILASCINTASAGTTPSSTCSSLFTAATPTGQVAPTDTIQAAYYMAQNPINNVAALYNLVGAAGAPFQPTYLAPYSQNSTNTGIATSAFNDTTLAINYAPTVSGTATPAVGAAFAVAIDGFGNAWLTNNGGVNNTTSSVSQLGVDGSVIVAPTSAFTVSATSGSTPQYTTPPTSTARTVTAPKGVAVDLNNRAWVANFGDAATGGTVVSTATPPVTSTPTTGTVGIFSAATAPGIAGVGGTLGASGYFVGSGPWGVAIDGTNNVFVANTTTASTSVLDGRSLARLAAADGTYTYSTNGATTSQSSLAGGSTLLAIDTNTTPIVYAPSILGCHVQGQFNAVTYFGLIGEFSDATVQPLLGSDIVSNYSGQAVGAGVSGGNCASTSQFVGQVVAAAIANPFGVAVDRTNGVYITDEFTSSLGFDGITYLSAGNPATGLIPTSTFLVNGVLPTTGSAGVGGTTINKAGADFVDGNNNVWVANQSKNSVVEATMVGATPGASGTVTLLTPGQGANLGAGAAYGVGFQHNQGNSTGLAIDASGNVWVTNQSTTGMYTNQTGASTFVGNSVTVVVGAAGPVITPTSLAIKYTKLGTKP